MLEHGLRTLALADTEGREGRNPAVLIVKIGMRWDSAVAGGSEAWDFSFLNRKKQRVTDGRAVGWEG